MLAGHGSGAWPGALAPGAAPARLERFDPALAPEHRARLLDGWHKAVCRAMA
jgi:glycerol kinase